MRSKEDGEGIREGEGKFLSDCFAISIWGLPEVRINNMYYHDLLVLVRVGVYDCVTYMSEGLFYQVREGWYLYFQPCIDLFG